MVACRPLAKATAPPFGPATTWSIHFRGRSAIRSTVPAASTEATSPSSPPVRSFFPSRNGDADRMAPEWTLVASAAGPFYSAAATTGSVCNSGTTAGSFYSGTTAGSFYSAASAARSVCNSAAASTRTVCNSATAPARPTFK